MTLLNCLCFCKFRLSLCNFCPSSFTVDGNEYFLTFGDVQVIKFVLQRKYKSDLIQMLAFYI